jgi:hypothetical protein
MLGCGTQENASHWTSPTYSGGEGGSPCCFPSLPACVYKFLTNLNNIIFIDNSLGPLARESPCTISMWCLAAIMC